MAGTVWPALIAGKKAKASEVEAKFDWIEGDIVPMSGGNQTDNAFDLGSPTARWAKAYTLEVNAGSANLVLDGLGQTIVRVSSTNTFFINTIGAGIGVAPVQALHVASGDTFTAIHLSNTVTGHTVADGWDIFIQSTTAFLTLLENDNMKLSVNGESGSRSFEVNPGAAITVPRISTTQRDNSVTAQDGMILYNTTTSKFNFREAGAWNEVVNGPTFRISKTDAGQTVTAAGTNTLTFNNIDFDEASTTTNSALFIPGIIGKYFFVASASNNDNIGAAIRVYKNTSTAVVLSYQGESGASQQVVSGFVQADTTTDQFFVRYSVNTTTVVPVGQNDIFFSGYRVSS